MNKEEEYEGEVLTATEMIFELCFPYEIQKITIHNYITAQNE